MLLYVDQHAPRIILGRVAGAAELGYFIFARRLVENSVALLNAPLRTTALSAFAAIQSDLARVRRAYAEGIGLTTSLMFPASAGIALVAPQLVEVLVGKTWSPAVPLLQLLILASIRQSFHIWNAAMLRGLGSPQLLLGASLLRTCSILFLIFLLLEWRSVGAAGAILAGSLLSWPAAVWFVRQVSGLGPLDQLRPGRAPTLATAVMAGTVCILQALVGGRLAAGLELAVLALAGAVVYSAAMWQTGRAELEAIARAVRMLRSKKPNGATTGSGATESS